MSLLSKKLIVLIPAIVLVAAACNQKAAFQAGSLIVHGNKIFIDEKTSGQKIEMKVGQLVQVKLAPSGIYSKGGWNESIVSDNKNILVPDTGVYEGQRPDGKPGGYYPQIITYEPYLGNDSNCSTGGIPRSECDFVFKTFTAKNIGAAKISAFHTPALQCGELVACAPDQTYSVNVIVTN